MDERPRERGPGEPLQPGPPRPDAAPAKGARRRRRAAAPAGEPDRKPDGGAAPPPGPAPPPPRETGGEEAEGAPPPRAGGQLVAILVFLAVAEAAAIAYFYAQYYSQNLMSISLQGKLDQTAAVANERSAELARQIDTLNRIKQEFVRVDNERKALERGIAEKERLAADLDARLRETSESERVARLSLGRQEQIAAYLRRRLKESKETEMELHTRLEELTARQREMEGRIARMRGPGAPVEGAEIELRETVVADASAAPRDIAGQVLIANERYRFIIVNLGSDDGVGIGDEGVIENDGVQVGRARVKKIYNKMCLADVVQAAAGQQVDKKSTVRFTRPAPREAS
ncbi:MAG: hypothetical protein PHN82_10735 [bacterium]|nr:hypothetical protein [bacterium]